MHGRAIGGARGYGALTVLGLIAFTGVASAQPQDPRTRYTVFRVGADLGIARLAGENFLQVNATGLMRLGPWRTDFAVPLRFSLSNDFRFRTEDYAEARDYLRAIRCSRIDIGDYDRPPDRYDADCDAYDWHEGLHTRMYMTARIFPLRNYSFGHDTLLHNFNGSLDPNFPQMGGIFEGLIRDIAHVRGVVDDIVNPGVVAAQAAIRPLQVAGQDWDETPDDLQISASVVSDVSAPVRVRGAFGQPLRDSNGNLQSTTSRLTALNADAHYLYLWSRCGEQSSGRCEAASLTGLFMFADYNRFMEVTDADGLHAGVHFRYRLHNRYRQMNGQAIGEGGRMFRTFEVAAGAEYRNMGNRYLPGYFDGNYWAQRYQFALNSDAVRLLGENALTTSKLEYVLSQPEGRVHGFQAYFRVYIPVPTAQGEPPSRLPITLYAEDGGGPLRASWGASVGPFRLDQIVVAASFARRNFSGLEEAFSLDGAAIQLRGAVFLSSEQSRQNNRDSLLSNLMINFGYNRRFLRDEVGGLRTTNDFLVTLGTSAGLN